MTIQYICYHPFMISNSVAVHVNETTMLVAAVVEAEARLSDHARPYHHHHHHATPPSPPCSHSLTHDNTAGHHDWRFPASHHLTSHFRDQPLKVSFSSIGGQEQVMGKGLGPPEAIWHHPLAGTYMGGVPLTQLHSTSSPQHHPKPKVCTQLPAREANKSHTTIHILHCQIETTIECTDEMYKKE